LYLWSDAQLNVGFVPTVEEDGANVSSARRLPVLVTYKVPLLPVLRPGCLPSPTAPGQMEAEEADPPFRLIHTYIAGGSEGH
jgi:hypothetical protein